jgi:hypothetical protein
MPDTPDNETEAVICHNRQLSISFQDRSKFFKEATKLIKNKKYRLSKGYELKEAMITTEQFETLVKHSLNTNKSQIQVKPYKINYRLLDKRWLEIENESYIDTLSYIYSLLKEAKRLNNAISISIKYQFRRFIINKIFNYNWWVK